MLWPVLNVLAGLVVAAIVVYKLTVLVDKFTPLERFGLGGIGGSVVLTMAPVMSVYPTPYEDWSGTLLRVGCAVYFIGRVTRHRYWSSVARRAAEAHLRSRGKL